MILLHFHKFQSIANYWWKFYSDRTRRKPLLRYGLWKTVSKHLNETIYLHTAFSWDIIYLNLFADILNKTMFSILLMSICNLVTYRSIRLVSLLNTSNGSPAILFSNKLLQRKNSKLLKLDKWSEIKRKPKRVIPRSLHLPLDEIMDLRQICSCAEACKSVKLRVKSAPRCGKCWICTPNYTGVQIRHLPPLQRVYPQFAHFWISTSNGYIYYICTRLRTFIFVYFEIRLLTFNMLSLYFYAPSSRYFKTFMHWQ